MPKRKFSSREALLAQPLAAKETAKKQVNSNLDCSLEPDLPEISRRQHLERPLYVSLSRISKASSEN